MGRQTRKAKALLMLPPNNIHNNNWVKKIQILIKLNALKVKNKDIDNYKSNINKSPITHKPDATQIHI